MRGLLFFSLSTLVLISVSHCGNSEEASLPNPNSNPIQITNAYPSVVRVLSIGQLCSGVLVSPRAMLTAAHCVKPGHNVSIQTNLGRSDSNQVIRNGPGSVGDSKDLAVVIFPQPVSINEPYYSIGRAKVGEEVELVGFGCTNPAGHIGSGHKRAGSNVLYRISEYLEVLTPFQNSSPKEKRILGPSNRAGSCFGDSGGPMLKNNGKGFVLIGIDHAVIPDKGQQISAYTDLYRSENLEFLRKVNAEFNLSIQGL